jgi:RimJ/RimL family protein N-acetyltransferase
VIDAGPLILRPWDRSDTSFVFDTCQDVDIRRTLNLPTPFTAGRAAAFVGRHARPQPEDDGAYFAITRTDNGELLGGLSLPAIDWAFRTASLRYWVAVDARRQGIASTAVAAAARWGISALDLIEVTVTASPALPGSIEVARRAGFEIDGADQARLARRVGL